MHNKLNCETIKDFLNSDFDDVFQKASVFSNMCNGFKSTRHFHYKRVSTNGSAAVRNVYDIYSNESREMMYLASNDYLNLTNHPEVIEAGAKALFKYGAGAGSVPLLGGTTDLHEELAQKVAAFKGAAASVLYTSGFGANFGSLSAILGPKDLAIIDMLAHASILDGCEKTNRRFFLHNDMLSLERVLAETKNKYRTVIIAVDGVYSMDGDIAPLDKIYELAQHYGAYIYLDEAHATGVIGKNGKGTPSHFGLEGKIDFVAGTFSKALGGVGGFLASSEEIALMLKFFSRHYMFSTAMAPQIAGSMIKSIEIVQADYCRREDLWRNIKFFKEGLTLIGFDVSKSETAIFPVILKDDYLVREATKMLQELNVYVNPVLYPAVALKASRLRISLMSEFSIEQLAEVLNKIEFVAKKLSIL